ncbi:hypothetical protein J6590_036883 [Homalodisca vitripennis]|nr:hypothetical protein J6590_036883 [Homalodisca vitripennis]
MKVCHGWFYNYQPVTVNEDGPVTFHCRGSCAGVSIGVATHLNTGVRLLVSSESHFSPVFLLLSISLVVDLDHNTTDNVTVRYRTILACGYWSAQTTLLSHFPSPVVDLDLHTTDNVTVRYRTILACGYWSARNHTSLPSSVSCRRPRPTHLRPHFSPIFRLLLST